MDFTDNRGNPLQTGAFYARGDNGSIGLIILTRLTNTYGCHHIGVLVKKQLFRITENGATVWEKGQGFHRPRWREGFEKEFSHSIGATRASVSKLYRINSDDLSIYCDSEQDFEAHLELMQRVEGEMMLNAGTLL